MSSLKYGVTVLSLFSLLAVGCDGLVDPIGGEHGATFRQLGTDYTEAYGLSANGTVVVGHGNGIAVRWNGDAEQEIGDLPGGDISSFASDVSADGSIVVGQGTTEEESEAFRWKNGRLEELDVLPDDGLHLSSANAISADGTTIVGLSHSGGNVKEAFRWKSGVIKGLGDLQGGNHFSEAFGVSADGSVIVGYSYSSNGIEAFRWEDDIMEGLGFFPNPSVSNPSSRARDITPDGSIIVGTASADHSDYMGPVACRWQNGEIEALGQLVEQHPASVSEAYATSADGSVIVGQSREQTPGSTGLRDAAFIWTQEKGFRNLKTVLEIEYGLDLTGWLLYNATDISDDGRVIVGIGEGPDGHVHGWRAVLGND